MDLGVYLFLAAVVASTIIFNLHNFERRSRMTDAERDIEDDEIGKEDIQL